MQDKSQLAFLQVSSLKKFIALTTLIMEMVMSNPFDDEGAEFLVLVNGENQHSLWPCDTEVPEGWVVTRGPSSRQDCLAYVDENWTDMRPTSLIINK
jgi:MbtH protein